MGPGQQEAFQVDALRHPIEDGNDFGREMDQLLVQGVVVAIQVQTIDCHHKAVDLHHLV